MRYSRNCFKKNYIQMCKIYLPQCYHLDNKNLVNSEIYKYTGVISVVIECFIFKFSYLQTRRHQSIRCKHLSVRSDLRKYNFFLFKTNSIHLRPISIFIFDTTIWLVNNNLNNITIYNSLEVL